MFLVRIQQQRTKAMNNRAQTMMTVAPVAKDAHWMLIRENPPADWLIVFSVSSVCWIRILCSSGIPETLRHHPVCLSWNM